MGQDVQPGHERIRPADISLVTSPLPVNSRKNYGLGTGTIIELQGLRYIFGKQEESVPQDLNTALRGVLGKGLWIVE